MSNFRRRTGFAGPPCNGWLQRLGPPLRLSSPALWRGSSAPPRSLVARFSPAPRGRQPFARPAAIDGLPALTGPSLPWPHRVAGAHPRWHRPGDRGRRLGFPRWCQSPLRYSGFAEAFDRLLRARAVPRWMGHARVRRFATRSPAQRIREDRSGRGGAPKSGSCSGRWRRRRSDSRGRRCPANRKDTGSTRRRAGNGRERHRTSWLER